MSDPERSAKTKMAGVMQSEFSLPKTQCSAFLSDLENAGLTGSTPAKIDDAEFIIPITYYGKKERAPFLSFWGSPLESKNRCIDLHWIIGDDEIARQVEETLQKNLGIVTFKSL